MAYIAIAMAYLVIVNIVMAELRSTLRWRQQHPVCVRGYCRGMYSYGQCSYGRTAIYPALVAPPAGTGLYWYGLHSYGLVMACTVPASVVSAESIMAGTGRAGTGQCFDKRRAAARHVQTRYGRRGATSSPVPSTARSRNLLLNVPSDVRWNVPQVTDWLGWGSCSVSCRCPKHPRT